MPEPSGEIIQPEIDSTENKEAEGHKSKKAKKQLSRKTQRPEGGPGRRDIAESKQKATTIKEELKQIDESKNLPDKFGKIGQKIKNFVGGVFGGDFVSNEPYEEQPVEKDIENLPNSKVLQLGLDVFNNRVFGRQKPLTLNDLWEMKKFKFEAECTYPKNGQKWRLVLDRDPKGQPLDTNMYPYLIDHGKTLVSEYKLIKPWLSKKYQKDTKFADPENIVDTTQPRLTIYDQSKKDYHTIFNDSTLDNINVVRKYYNEQNPNVILGTLETLWNIVEEPEIGDPTVEDYGQTSWRANEEYKETALRVYPDFIQGANTRRKINEDLLQRTIGRDHDWNFHLGRLKRMLDMTAVVYKGGGDIKVTPILSLKDRLRGRKTPSTSG